jgi:hypothetical protein
VLIQLNLYVTVYMMVLFQGSPQAAGVMTRASAGNALHSPGTYQLVMDPRLGLIVGAVTSPQATQGVCGERPSMSSSSCSSAFVFYITVLLRKHIPYEPILQ